jgi:hypothetical protein
MRDCPNSPDELSQRFLLALIKLSRYSWRACACRSLSRRTVTTSVPFASATIASASSMVSQTATTFFPSMSMTTAYPRATNASVSMRSRQRGVVICASSLRRQPKINLVYQVNMQSRIERCRQGLQLRLPVRFTDPNENEPVPIESSLVPHPATAFEH